MASGPTSTKAIRRWSSHLIWFAGSLNRFSIASDPDVPVTCAVAVDVFATTSHFGSVLPQRFSLGVVKLTKTVKFVVVILPLDAYSRT